MKPLLARKLRKHAASTLQSCYYIAHVYVRAGIGCSSIDKREKWSQTLHDGMELKRCSGGITGWKSNKREEKI